MANFTDFTSASAHDAHERQDTGAVDITNATMSFGAQGPARDVGMYFDNIPTDFDGSSSVVASIHFTPGATDSGAFVGTWKVEDSITPSVFTTTTNDITNRTLNAAADDGDGGDMGSWTDGTPIEVTGLNTVLQAMADKGGTNITAIAVIHLYTSGGGERVCDAEDGAGTDDQPQIDVDYTPAGGAANPKGPFGHPFHGPFAGPIGP